MDFGVSYYPELVPAAEWRRDLSLMRDAGLSVVRILDFAWTALEPREGDYQWDWLDRFLKLADSLKLKVVLCTPTAAPPAWLAQQYPTVMLQLANGRRRPFGSRRDGDVCSPIYRDFSREIATRLGTRYGHHPAVIGWQIDNELFGPENAPPESHSLDSQWCFRRWLKERYGSVRALNQAWGMRFWNQEFSDWGEVTTPMHDRVCRGWAIDHARFFSDMQAAYLALQYDALRSVIHKRQWVTHNSTAMFDRGLDHGQWAAALDCAGWDAYPGAASAGRGFNEAFTALACDWLRASTAKPIKIMETAVGPEHISDAYIAMLRAHGADLLIFWHWRVVPFNVEQNSATFCDYAGRPWTHRIDWLKKLTGRRAWSVARPGPVRRQQAALLFSLDNQRVNLHPDPYWRGKLVDYLGAVIRLYEPFWRAGVGIDVVQPGDKLDGYKLLLLPSLRLLDPQDAEPIRRLVRTGGVLVAAAKTGHQSTTGVFHPTLASPLADVLGIEIRQDVSCTESPTAVTTEGRRMACGPYVERLEKWDGKVLATFVDGPAADRPALLRRRLGKGCVYYQAATSAEMTTMIAPLALADIGLPVAPSDGEEMIRPDTLGRSRWRLRFHGSQASFSLEK